MMRVDLHCKVCARRLLSEGTFEQVLADVERFKREHPHAFTEPEASR